MFLDQSGPPKDHESDLGTSHRLVVVLYITVNAVKAHLVARFELESDDDAAAVEAELEEQLRNFEVTGDMHRRKKNKDDLDDK